MQGTSILLLENEMLGKSLWVLEGGLGPSKWSSHYGLELISPQPDFLL